MRDQASHCITAHGGIVEKFAGDAVMAAFGVQVAHEDDPERAVRAALAIVDAVRELELEVRIGIESGEIVADDTETTFATGLAINAAARLQQAARPGQILLGSAAERLTRDTVVTTPLGAQEARGFPSGVEAWKLVSVSDDVGRRLVSSVPLVGREEELESLDNNVRRAVRDRRAHLVTVYGAAGVGKSRLAREFVDGVERSTILAWAAPSVRRGRHLLGDRQMVKIAAGITDDDSVDAAAEKLRLCCGDEAVADLLSLAVGVLDAVGGERSASEIAWAAQAWATELADLQPLVLVFEDIHWAEGPMLDLIEHLAGGVREVPLLLVCLARSDLLQRAPEVGWRQRPGNRSRARAVAETREREARRGPREHRVGRAHGRAARGGARNGRGESALHRGDGADAAQSGGEPEGIPHTVQAMIAARIDRLPVPERTVLRRAAVAGRVFWSGALDALGDTEVAGGGLRELVARHSSFSVSLARTDPRRGGVPLQARAHSRRRRRRPVEVVPRSPAPPDGPVACRSPGCGRDRGDQGVPPGRVRPARRGAGGAGRRGSGGRDGRGARAGGTPSARA